MQWQHGLLFLVTTFRHVQVLIWTYPILRGAKLINDFWSRGALVVEMPVFSQECD